LKKRDKKGLFKKAEEGQLQNVAGISIPYEESTRPEVVVDADKESSWDAANKTFNKLLELGLLKEEDRSVLLDQEEKEIRRILRESWFK
jgi:adenylylsulfate kinase-like enzyme